MYKILVDNILMCDSRIEELALINPVVTLEENKAGSFSFKIPPEHPYYDLIQRRKSIVQVFQDDEKEPIFSGMCIEITNDFYKQKEIYCEGELSYFNDSIQRQAKYQDVTIRGLLENFITKHNEQVEEEKRFHVGIVTVTDSNDSLYCYSNMESTMKCLKEDLVDDLGGFFRVRHADGVKYLDYLAGSQNTNTQIIKLGKNLLDFSNNIDSSEIATAIIPLGARLEEAEVEGLEKRLTIENINDGKDYVFSQDAVDSYGWIYKVVAWDDVTIAEELKSKAEKYLSQIQYENMVIEAKAVDLHLDNSEIERFKLSDEIRVVSKPHGLDKYFRLTKMTINLNNPESNTITLGKEENVGLSAKTNKENEEIKNAINEFSPNTILNAAIENATQLIKNSMNGYISTVMNEDGVPKELLIMDAPTKETATKVWRWNINGLGYSETGYDGEYALAITMDGSIVADRITTGTMFADRIKGGTLTLGGTDNENGSIVVFDSEGNIVGTFDKEGLTAKNGHFEGKIVSKDATITGGTIKMSTSSNSYDVIDLVYNSSSTKIRPGYLSLNSGSYRTSLSDSQISLEYGSNHSYLNPGSLSISYSGKSTSIVGGNASFGGNVSVDGVLTAKGSCKLGNTSYDTLGFFGSSGSSKKSVSTITSTTSATASTNASKINEIINALKAYNLM